MRASVNFWSLSGMLEQLHVVELRRRFGGFFSQRLRVDGKQPLGIGIGLPGAGWAAVWRLRRRPSSAQHAANAAQRMLMPVQCRSPRQMRAYAATGCNTAAPCRASRAPRPAHRHRRAGALSHRQAPGARHAARPHRRAHRRDRGLSARRSHRLRAPRANYQQRAAVRRRAARPMCAWSTAPASRSTSPPKRRAWAPRC